jgi:hypothetical protein
MRRAGCSFPEAANGNALQTPGAELAKAALIGVTEAALNPESTSILKGRCWPVAFIHDEILSEILDSDMTHEVAYEKSRIMVAYGRRIVPDVDLKASPCLMLRWHKEAEPRFNQEGRLIPWQPL